MNTLSRTVVLAAAACLSVLAALAQGKVGKPQPDVLIFTNGDQLKGMLIRGVGQTIVFKSDMAGEITVGLDKVRELRSAGSFAVLRKNVPIERQPVTPGRIVVTDGTLTVMNRAEPGETVAAKDVGYIFDEKTYEHDIAGQHSVLQGWNGSLSAGATMVRATQNGVTYNAGIALVRAIPVVTYLPKQTRTTLDFVETFGKITQPAIAVNDTPASQAKTSIFHADLEQDVYLSPRFYALAETAFDHNFAQGLDLQQIYGGGFGWTPLQNPVQQLDLKADVHFEKQQFSGMGANPNLFGSTFAEAYRRTLPRKIVLTETASILPAWNQSNAYSANASVILALPVIHRFSMTLTTTDNFLNDPAAGFKKNSFQFVTGLNYTLR